MHPQIPRKSRKAQLQEFSQDLTWLEDEPAKRSYHYALQYARDDGYHLDPETVDRIERHEIESQNVALAWVRDRVPMDDHTVRVVLGHREVFLVPTRLFVARWPDMLVPARDDALILPDRSTWILYYCHEDELEFGWRR